MRQVLARLARSGLTQREFGLREGLPLSTIAWWRRVWRGAGAQLALPNRRDGARVAGEAKTARPTFVEVKIEAPPLAPAGVTLEVVVRSGQVIRVPRHFDGTTLRAVVAALESGC
jgi:hypothetical protein